jgi:hypothetical protein
MKYQLALLAVLAGACGDGGGTPDAPPPIPDGPIPAAAYEGMWLMTATTFETDTGPMTLERNGTPLGLRGDAVFAATGPATGSLDIRQVLLDDGLIASEITAFVAPVMLEGSRWLLTEQGGGVVVFQTALTGDHLVLTLDADDPRTTAENPPRSVELDRVPPWTTAVVGAWQLVSLTNASGTIVANTCTAIGPDTWATMGMDITFGMRHLFEREMTVTQFSDEQCTVPTGSQSSVQTGFAEEEGSATLRIWGVEGSNAEYQAFSIAIAGTDATLTRTACLPQPDCEDSAPITVVVRRAPAP